MRILFKKSNEESDKGYFLNINVLSPEKLHEFHDLQFLPERMEIEKVKKLVTNLHDKTMLFTQEI